jgi:hypothetical protein
MRELHGYHGEHRRHAHDAAADTAVARAHDRPKLQVLTDPEVRKAKNLQYRQQVEAGEAEYAAKHAKLQEAKPQEAKAERKPLESKDRAADRIASRDLPEHKEVARKRKPERSWLPSNETSQVVASVDALFSVVNASYHIIPGRVDGIAAAALGVVVAGVAWANKRWKDKHGDRPER